MSAAHARWTLLGTLATPARGLVDGRGRVSSAPGWAMDWWIGAEDRWHRAGQEASVRQHLVDDTPVVETAMRIPGGDAVHRAYVVRDRGPAGTDADLMVVEIENRSAVPVALALVVGPFDPYAPDQSGGSVSSLTLDTDPDGSVLLVDDRPGLWLAKPPARATAVVAGEDLAAAVMSGLAPSTLEPTACSRGRAQAALIHPLPHTAVLRVVLPLGGPDVSSAGNRRTRGRPVSFPATVSRAEQVAKGWEVQTRGGMSVTLPDPRWHALTEASRAFLLLGAGDVEAWVDAVDTIGSLDRWGFHDEAAQLLGGAGDPRRDPRPVDAATLVALADHLALTGDRALVVEELASVVAQAVRRADRPGRRLGRGRSDPVDPAAGVEWRARGLAAAVALLDAIDQPDAAAAVARRARRLGPSPLGSSPFGPAIVEPGPVAHPVWPGASSPARTLRRATRELVERAEAVATGTAPAPGSDGAVDDRVAWALSVLGPTQVWPEAVDPDRPLAAVGRGHDPVAGATWLQLVRTLLVTEAGSGAEAELALCTWWPREWRGQGIEVHHAPTTHGELSYALRWHGDRPALLWELEPRTESEPAVTLRAPGLDPTWSTREPRGEALLAQVAADGPSSGPQLPGMDPPDQGASFS